MAGIRITGLSSGLDTESLVGELSKAYQMKVDNAKKDQTRAEWKKEAWSALNTKLMNFYKGALSTFKSTGTYQTKGVKGNLTGVKITANNKAVNGNHKVQVISTASAQMWTGDKINNGTYAATTYEKATDASQAISALYDAEGHSIQTSLASSGFKVAVAGSDETVEIGIDASGSVSDMVDNINTQLQSKGISLTASFENGALKFTNTSASTSEGGKDITITASNETSAKALGLDVKGTTVRSASDENSVTGSVFAYNETSVAGTNVTASTKLIDLGIEEGTIIKVNDTSIAVNKSTTLNSLATSMEKAGINANYDANQGRFYLSSKGTGKANGFTIDADADTLAKLGLDCNDTGVTAGKKIEASDAEIIYNEVKYTQDTNTFNINGLTIEASAEGAEQQFSVDTDVDGIYEKVKNFVKEYNSLITEMNELYYADSSRGYDPLTSEEKDAMAEEDVEKWEKKIKDSLLRRDSTIGSLLTSMRTTLNKSVEVANADGTTSRYALSSFGIVTSTYTEKGLLHIQGDSEDTDFMDMEDRLKAAIVANPEALTKTLTALGTEMYENFQKAMKKSELSSALTFYNDKQIDSEIQDYKDKVTELQDKLAEEEDRYYEQFAAMETAMAKLQSQQTYVAQLFGG